MVAATASRESERSLSAVAHLSAFLGYFTGIGFWLGPLVVWLVFRERSRTVSQHAKEALNFNLSLLIYSAVVALSCFVLVGFLILPVFAVAVVVVQLVFPIIAAVRAQDGRSYRYPLTLRLIA